MTDKQAREIEQRHNVYVDAASEMYTTTGDRDDEYGWMPVHEEWKATYSLDELRR